MDARPAQSCGMKGLAACLVQSELMERTTSKHSSFLTTSPPRHFHFHEGRGGGGEKRFTARGEEGQPGQRERGERNSSAGERRRKGGFSSSLCG